MSLSSKSMLAAFGGLLFLCSVTPKLAVATSPTKTYHVSLEGGRISFLLPQGFYSLSPAQIAQKFPSTHAPKYAFATASEGVCIAVTLLPVHPSLPSAKNIFENTLPRVTPGFAWVSDRYTLINGTRWIDLEFTSHALDTDIHNDALFTTLDNEMVGVNFNATTNTYSRARSRFMSVKASLHVRQ